VDEKLALLSRDGQKHDFHDLAMSKAAYDGEVLKEIQDGKYQEQANSV
jgi:hypothetical protein